MDILYIYCIFVHPDLDSVPLLVGMRKSSIPDQKSRGFNCVQREGFFSTSRGFFFILCTEKPKRVGAFPLLLTFSVCELNLMKTAEILARSLANFHCQ